MKFTILMLLMLSIIGKSEINAGGREPLIGVKAYFNTAEIKAEFAQVTAKLPAELSAVGINTLFTTVYEGGTAFYKSALFRNSDTQLNLLEIREALSRENIKFGAVCQVFFDPDIVETEQRLVPVDQYGNSDYVNWQKMVCPTDSAYRAYKVKVISEVIRKFRPDYLSLDFMRYPVTWELTAPGAKDTEMRKFCYCPACLKKFSEAKKISIPEKVAGAGKAAEFIDQKYPDKWLEFKEEQINGFVKEISQMARRMRPEMQIVLHYVPWMLEDHNGAIRTIAAQDLITLSAYVDFISPMSYHRLIGRDGKFISKLNNQIIKLTGKPVLPSIQAADIGASKVNGEEFRDVLNSLSFPPAAGLLIFNWSGMDTEKKEILKAYIQNKTSR